MAKFKVTGYRCVTYYYNDEIEADDEDAAFDEFYDNLDYYQCSKKLIDGDIEIKEI